MDCGNIGQWFHKVFNDRYPGHWVTCGASGVIGFGLPGAMAARAIYPDRPIILLTGDGSIGFSIMELDSANRQGLGFVVLLADDEAWGITYSNQTEKYGHAITSKLGPIKFDLGAEGLGANSSKINNAKELVPALNSALNDKKRPSLIHIPVSTTNPALERG